MPLLGIDSYKIDFAVLESNNPKTLIILDQSYYLEDIEKPLLQITPPGFTGRIELEYTPNSIIVLNSDSLGLTEDCDYEDLADLPDGVYVIRMAVCPYDELYAKRCYLKTTRLDCMYENLLLTVDVDCMFDSQKTKNDIVDIDILIRSAKAEANRCNIEAATAKYRAAFKKLEKINKKLNCN